MYFSGTWRGWWEQAGWGRQSMTHFTLRFHDGVIEGEGRDVIERFIFQGTYDAQGNVRMIKQYTGKRSHQVLYVGTYDGEGTIFGQWSIGEFGSGPFAIAPVPPTVDPDAPIETL